jgi:hypothetical protein
MGRLRGQDEGSVLLSKQPCLEVIFFSESKPTSVSFPPSFPLFFPSQVETVVAYSAASEVSAAVAKGIEGKSKFLASL